MPRHLIAVIVLLVLCAFQLRYWLILPVLLLGPGLFMQLAPALLLLPFAGFVWLACGLGTRQPWAPRWIRIAMVVQIGLGALTFLLAATEWDWLILSDGAVVDVGIGGYVLWALGRGDVKAWLACVPPPAGPLPGTG